MKYRKFTSAFKQHLVEQMVSGLTRPAEICRRYNIAKQVLARWQKKYTQGELDTEPIAESIAKERVKQLEAMVGRLSMDNELLKKALRHALSQQRQNEDLSETTYPLSEIPEGGVEC